MSDDVAPETSDTIVVEVDPVVDTAVVGVPDPADPVVVDEVEVEDTGADSAEDVPETAPEASSVAWEHDADGEQAPFTPPIPQTGEGDMTSSPQPSNSPSVPGVELPSSVHDHSGGKTVTIRVPVEG